MLRAVSAVAVAMMSSSVHPLRAARQRSMRFVTYAGLNSSRPVDLGGGARKYGCASS